MDWMEGACTNPFCNETSIAHSLSSCASGLLTIIRYARLVARRELKEEARLIKWMEHAELCFDKKCIGVQHKMFTQPAVPDIDWVRAAAQEEG